MKFTKVPSTTFQQIQLNAGILLSDFDPSTGELDASDIIGATSGGVNFNAAPEYVDFGEDIDNVPNNTKELKKLDSFTVTMGGTFVTVTADNAAMLIGPADVSGNKITPRVDLEDADFKTLWWVGDYSDKNGENNGGFIAIEMLNSLSTGGFQIQSNDKGKGQFTFEFTGHYSLSAQSTVPFNVYVKDGADEDDATLSALSLSDMTIAPTFSASTTSYTSTTTSSTNTLTATTTDNSATKEVKLDGNAVTGTTITWGSSGSHTLTVKVTKGNATKTYTITVTKS